MTLGWESITVDDGGVFREVENSWFWVSFLSMVRWTLWDPFRRGGDVGHTWGFGVTLPTSTQLNPRLNSPGIDGSDRNIDIEKEVTNRRWPRRPCRTLLQAQPGLITGGPRAKKRAFDS